MKKILFILLMCLPIISMAKDKKDKSNPKYLTGAVTTIDGRVAFTKEINAPGLSKTDIFNQMLDWAKGRFKPDGKLYSQVSYSNEEEGVIAASAEEYIIFSSSALSLDRTRIYYQLLINTKDGKCDLMMTRIRYWYDEARDGGEKYSAEEWITDDMALNKKKTKLAPICGKFRRETIDLKDELFQSAASALGQKFLDTTPEAAPQSVPMQKLQPAIKINASAELKEVGLEQLPSNLNEIAAQGRITLTASNGEEIEIKADNWSGFGKMFNKNVSYLLIDQSRIAATALMEQSDTYKISFYTDDNSKASVVIECKKAMSQKMTAEELKSLNQNADTSKQYTMYIGEVTKTLMR